MIDNNKYDVIIVGSGAKDGIVLIGKKNYSA